MSWPEVSIEDIAQVKGGKRLPKGHELLQSETEHPYIRARDIGEGKIVITEPVYISEETHNVIKRYIVQEGDVVITIVGANVGDAGIIDAKLSGANLTENAAKLEVDKSKYNPYFLNLLLSMNGSKKRLAFIASGAAQGKLGLYKIKSFPIIAPPLAIQDEIVRVIQNYNNLIENNIRRILLLEESARMLYKEWFVYFRFPGHEHVKVVSGVPEGWSFREIGDIADYVNRGMTPEYDDDGEYTIINQKCIRDRLLSLDLSRKQTKDFNEDKAVKKYDVLINSTGTGTLGRVAQCWIELEKTTVDTHVTIVRPSENVAPLWFGYTLLGMEKIFEDMGEGATNQKELKRAYVSAYKIKVPPKNLMNEFDEIVESSIKQITNLLDQNKRLAEARDLLLPRLMNGDIAV